MFSKLGGILEGCEVGRCLFNWSLRAEIQMDLEPDSNNMLKPRYKSYAGQVVYENKENKFEFKRWKKKEDHGHSQQIKLYNFTVSLWDKRKEVLYLISFAMEAVDAV